MELDRSKGTHVKHKRKIEIAIEQWRHTRFWAVYVHGQLLTITAYKKGAVSLRDYLLS